MTRAISVPFLSLFMVLALVALPAEASVADNELFLPAVGTGAGVPPSHWYTTVWVFNPNPGPTDVEFSFLRRDQNNSPSDITHTMTVNPGEVVQIDDAINTMFGVNGFGAIRALADDPVHVTARIYSKTTGDQERDSSGQAFAAVPAGRSIGNGEETDVIGLTNLIGGDFRYNVGFVETTGQSVELQISLFSNSGGDWITTTIQLRPFEQAQKSIDALFNNIIGESDNFRLHVRGVLGNGRAIVFGSRIANGSQDATTFEMTYPPLP